MEKTPFAGLTRLAPGEALSTDEFSFQDRNPEITDKILRLAATSHKHDGHAALVPTTPEIPPVVTVDETGGLIPAATELTVVYTLIDADGGETASAADPVTETTIGGIEAPDNAPGLAVETTDGTLLAGNYVYGVSVTDGTGGETGIGTLAEITVTPVSDTNQIRISGLEQIMIDASGATWRLWRMVDGNPWGLLDTGTSDEVVDDGTFCLDATLSPPQGSNNQTNGTSRLKVTVPAAGQPAGAVLFRIYATTSGSFGNRSLLGEYPVADFGAEKTYTDLPTLEGSPPDSSLAMPGANKINALTDILNLSWKGPVANAAALPADGNEEGDVRVTLDDRLFHMYYSGAWHGAGGGGDLQAGTHVAWTFSDATTADIWAEEEVEDVTLIADEFDHDSLETDLWTAPAEMEISGGVLRALNHDDGGTRVITHAADVPQGDFYMGMTFSPLDTDWGLGGNFIALALTGTGGAAFTIGWDTAGLRVKILGTDFVLDEAVPVEVTEGTDSFQMVMERVGTDLTCSIYTNMGTPAFVVTYSADPGTYVVNSGAVADWTHTFDLTAVADLEDMLPGPTTRHFMIMSQEAVPGSETHAINAAVLSGPQITRKELRFALAGEERLMLDMRGDSDINPGRVIEVGDPLVGYYAGIPDEDWQHAPDRDPSRFWKDGATIEIGGSAHAVTVPDPGDTIFGLPVGYRPENPVSFQVASGDDTTPVAATGLISIETDGTVSWQGGETGTDNWISFDGVRYRIGS